MTVQPNVAGLVMAGSADFKVELGQSDMFDPRLQKIIVKTVDISYGGENGFNQVGYGNDRFMAPFFYFFLLGPIR
jgi:peptide chain release factor subunit 1